MDSTLDGLWDECASVYGAIHDEYQTALTSSQIHPTKVIVKSSFRESFYVLSSQRLRW